MSARKEHLADVTRYTRGARDDAAIKAATLQYERWQHAASREPNGRVTVEAGLTIAKIEDLLATGAHTFASIGRACGLTDASIHHAYRRATRVRTSTARRVEELWEAYCAPLEEPERLWPSQPLLDAIARKFGSYGAAEQDHIIRHLKAHDAIREELADRYCGKLELYPEQVWDGWLETEGVA